MSTPYPAPATLTSAAPATTVANPNMPAISSPVYTGPTSLVVSSTAGLAVGMAIVIRSALGVNSDQATISAINGLTPTLATPLHNGYVVGDLVMPLAPLSPYYTLYPQGPNTPGAQNWPS